MKKLTIALLLALALVLVGCEEPAEEEPLEEDIGSLPAITYNLA